MTEHQSHVNLWLEERRVTWEIKAFKATGCVCRCPHARDKLYLPQTLQGTHGSQTTFLSPPPLSDSSSLLGAGPLVGLTCSAADEPGDTFSLSADQLAGFSASFPPRRVLPAVLCLSFLTEQGFAIHFVLYSGRVTARCLLPSGGS